MTTAPFYRCGGLSALLPALLLAGAVPSGGLAQQGEFEQLVVSYRKLTTVAGLGEKEDGNFWQAGFEGAAAAAIELSNPHMTMADAAGNLYIADKESHSVLKVDRRGIATTAAGTHVAGFNGDGGIARQVQLDSPNGLHVLPDGTFYVLDTFNRRIRRVDRAGIMSTVVEDPEGFGPGRGLWVSPDQSEIFYNGPGRVMRWTATGGSEVFADGFLDPGNLAVDAAGRLIVTDRGAHLVYRIAPGGARAVIAGDGSTAEPVDGRRATDIGLEAVRGIACRPDGSYFVCTQKGGDVVFIDTNGIANRFLTGAGSGNIREGEGLPPESPGDKISEPRAIALAPGGDLIITTNDKGLVRIVQALRPPGGVRMSLAGDGKPLLSWQVEAGVAVDVEASATLDTWTLTAAGVTNGTYRAGAEAAGAWFYRLRPHRQRPAP